MSCNSKTVTLDRRNTTLPRPAAHSVNTGLRAPTPEALADPSLLLRLLRDYYDAIKTASGAVHPSRIPQLKSMALPNYQELRATLGDAQGNAGPRAVIVAGRTLPLDGGEGVFAWSPDSTALDDDDTVIQVPGVGVGRWIKMLSALSESAREQYYAQTLFYVNPTSGSDRARGTTSAEALRTVSEVARRTAGAVYSSGGPVTVYLLAGMATTDTPVFAVSVIGTHAGLKVDGGLGMSTVLTGTVTGVQSIAGTTSGVTNDYWIEDSAVPVSWTASGALADGLAFKRTNGTECWWFAAKDLGSKRLRVSCPLNLSQAEVALSTSNPYTLYSLPAVNGFSGCEDIPIEFELCAPSNPITWYNAPRAATLDRCSMALRWRMRGTTVSYNSRFRPTTPGNTGFACDDWNGFIAGGLIMGGYQIANSSPNQHGVATPMIQGGPVWYQHDAHSHMVTVRVYDATGTYVISTGIEADVLFDWVSGSGSTCTKLAQVRQGTILKYNTLPPASFNSSDTWEIGGVDFAQSVLSGSATGVTNLSAMAGAVVGG